MYISNMANGVVAIVKRKNNLKEWEYLLVTSLKDRGEFSGAYYPPGGHVEEGESDQQALTREIREELGVDIKIQGLVKEFPGDVPGLTISWWECELPDTNFNIQSEEVDKVGFFTKKEMAHLKLWPATKKFFESYQE